MLHFHLDLLPPILPCLFGLPCPFGPLPCSPPSQYLLLPFLLSTTGYSASLSVAKRFYMQPSRPFKCPRLHLLSCTAEHASTLPWLVSFCLAADFELQILVAFCAVIVFNAMPRLPLSAGCHPEVLVAASRVIRSSLFMRQRLS